jgi:membrane protein DedA with SNARE-associated domain
MFSQIIESIRPIVVTYGAYGVFIISVAEEVIAPIPSTLTIFTAGFFLIPASAPLLEVIGIAILKVALPAALGITLGSLFVYGLVYWGGKPLVEKLGRWIGISWNDIEKSEKYFEKGWKDEMILLVLRATPLIPNSAISAFCGFIRYPLKNFIVITFLGTLLRAFIMAMIGWRVGEAYLDYATWFNDLENYIWLAAGIILLIFLTRVFRRRYSDA